MKIGVVSDLHLKEKLSYADYIEDGRQSEKELILSFIPKELSDCDTIILLGDQFNSKNNPSIVVKEFVSFLESFDPKQTIYIISGNHEIHANGLGALDFIGELRGKPNWILVNHLTQVTNKNSKIVLCPYMTKAALRKTNNEEALKELMKMIKGQEGNMFFCHQSISDTMCGDINVNLFNELVLPKDKLEKQFDLIFAGHIHNSFHKDKTYIAGSIFSNDTADNRKYIWKINDKTLEVEKVEVPGRLIVKAENPALADINMVNRTSIVKVVLTKKRTKEEMTALKKELNKFDAHILIEQYPNERKKMHFTEGESILNLDLEKLLDIYAKSRGIELKKLLNALELLKL